jgi:hypothetical protein
MFLATIDPLIAAGVVLATAATDAVYVMFTSAVRYVGFFKRIRDTRFARLDTLAYSPLCAMLAVLSGITASR